jgi:hypothetical protein
VELVQWIVAEGAAVRVVFAPAWADRVPRPDGGSWRRRGAPLSSRWLVCPFAVGVDAAAPSDDAGAQSACAAWGLDKTPGAATLSLRVVLDAPGQPAALPEGSSDVRAAALWAELVKVVSDLAETAGLPVMAVTVRSDRRGLTLVLGALAGFRLSALQDALLLFVVASETCALQRGFALDGAQLEGGPAPVVIDGTLLPGGAP